MSTPKTHHFIPRFQLDYFQTPEECVLQFDCKESKLVSASTRNLAAENHLYAWNKEDGTKDVSVELFLSDMEGQIAPIIDKIHNSDFELTNEERSLLSFFVALQLFRTPQNRERTKQSVAKMTKKMMRFSASVDKAFASTLERAGEKHPELLGLSEEQIEDIRRTFYEEDYELEVPSEYFLHYMIEGCQDIAHHIHDIQWVFLTAPKGSQFITSDDPYVMVRKREKDDPFWVGPGIKIVGTKITLPITPKICLFMTPAPQSTTTISATKKMVRTINKRTAAHCRRFIYGANEALLSNLAKQCKLSDRGVKEARIVVESAF